MAIGAAQTKKFKIGTAEVRIGLMTSANKLTQNHSIGLLDNVTVEVAQNAVDLLGGFPKTLQDTAVVSQEVNITANLREYSRRNMLVMLGSGIEATAPTDTPSLVVSNETAAAPSVDVSGGTGSDFAAGEIVVIYPEGRAEEVTVARIASISVDTLTFDTGTPTLHAYDGTSETIHIFNAQPLAVGDIDKTNYFCMQVLEVERSTGNPVGFNFWKCAVASGMTVGNNADDFAATDLQVKALQPSAAEYAGGADLNHLANIIPTYPTGMYVGGKD